ncbi:MAG: hypothetical protein H6R17_4027 [Proteobacteria bacterium]|nr:hypothetical protein [Pseudomonadota bacterium]
MVAGIWLAVAPWVLGHGESEPLVLFNFVGIGAALVLFSGGALTKPETWEEVIDFLIGLWAIASPWVLGFSGMRDLTTNAVVVGLLVAVLSAWTAMARSHAIERWRKHGHV